MHLSPLILPPLALAKWEGSPQVKQQPDTVSPRYGLCPSGHGIGHHLSVLQMQMQAPACCYRARAGLSARKGKESGNPCKLATFHDVLTW
nr:unnamed protein product [Digitaria exilis]